MTTEGQNTPVSTPSGPSAGLEGQDATQEPRDATEAALRAEVERLRGSGLQHIEDGLETSDALIAALGRADAAEAEVGRLGVLLQTAEDDRDQFDSERLDATTRAKAAEAERDRLAATLARVHELAERWEEATVWPDKPDRVLRGAAARLRIALDAPKDTTAP